MQSLTESYKFVRRQLMTFGITAAHPVKLHSCLLHLIYAEYSTFAGRTADILHSAESTDVTGLQNGKPAGFHSVFGT